MSVRDLTGSVNSDIGVATCRYHVELSEYAQESMIWTVRTVDPSRKQLWERRCEHDSAYVGGLAEFVDDLCVLSPETGSCRTVSVPVSRIST